MTVREVKQRRMKIVSGYDYGTLNPSAHVIIGVDPQYGDWYFLDELYEPCSGVKRHVARLKQSPYVKGGLIQYTKCDHSLGFKNQQQAGGLSCVVDLFRKEGFHMTPGRKGAGDTLRVMLLDRWSNVDEWAAWDREEAKRLQAGEPPRRRPPRAYITAGCPKLWWECQRLRLKEHTSAAVAARKNEPDQIMDKDDHAYQAAAYVLDTMPEAKVARARQGRGVTWDDIDRQIR
jgi:hypothetical protein